MFGIANDLGTAITTAAMMGDLTEQEFDHLMDIHLRVIREMVCPVTGRVLDSRTAALWDVTLPDGNTNKFVFDPSVKRETLESALRPGLTLGDRFDPAPVWERLANG